MVSSSSSRVGSSFRLSLKKQIMSTIVMGLVILEDEPPDACLIIRSFSNFFCRISFFWKIPCLCPFEINPCSKRIRQTSSGNRGEVERFFMVYAFLRITLQRHFVIPSLRSRTGLRSKATKNLDFSSSICQQIVDSSLSRPAGSLRMTSQPKCRCKDKRVYKNPTVILLNQNRSLFIPRAILGKEVNCSL